MTDKDGNRHYLHYDQVGSLRAISRVLSPDNTIKVVKEITYDTYGNILSDTNPSFKVPFGFAGGLYDPDTELTHFGYREYDAYTGKWTAKDPIGFDGGDSNLYGYVLQDPVNLIDPWGLEDASAGDIIAGIVTAPVKGATVITEASKNAPELIQGTKAIMKKWKNNKKYEDCCKKKEKSNSECYLDAYGK